MILNLPNAEALNTVPFIVAAHKHKIISLLLCRVCSRPARTTRPPVLLTTVYSANFHLHLSHFNFSLIFISLPSSFSPLNPGPFTLIYSQPPSTHGRPCHLTRHAASANQGHVSTKYGLVYTASIMVHLCSSQDGRRLFSGV